MFPFFLIFVLSVVSAQWQWSTVPPTQYPQGTGQISLIIPASAYVGANMFPKSNKTTALRILSMVDLEVPALAPRRYYINTLDLTDKIIVHMLKQFLNLVALNDGKHNTFISNRERTDAYKYARELFVKTKNE